MICIIRFDLRYFLGFLTAFYLFVLQLIHSDKIRGLGRFKMAFVIFNLKIIKNLVVIHGNTLPLLKISIK